jgi:hypothetical protein
VATRPPALVLARRIAGHPTRSPTVADGVEPEVLLPRRSTGPYSSSAQQPLGGKRGSTSSASAAP